MLKRKKYHAYLKPIRVVISVRSSVLIGSFVALRKWHAMAFTKKNSIFQDVLVSIMGNPLWVKPRTDLVIIKY